MRKLFILNDDNVEYVAEIREDGEEVILKYSDTGVWVPEYRGKECARITSDGNAAAVLMPDALVVSLDYCDLERLSVLLSVFNRDRKSRLAFYKKVKS